MKEASAAKEGSRPGVNDVDSEPAQKSKKEQDRDAEQKIHKAAGEEGAAEKVIGAKKQAHGSNQGRKTLHFMTDEEKAKARAASYSGAHTISVLFLWTCSSVLVDLSGVRVRCMCCVGVVGVMLSVGCCIGGSVGLCAGVALPSAGAGKHDPGKRGHSKGLGAHLESQPSEGGDMSSQDQAAVLSDLPKAARKNMKRKMKRENSWVGSQKTLAQA